MSRLAGFDAVVEFSPAALMNAIFSDPQWRDVLPPFERRIDLAAVGGAEDGDGQAHFIFDALSFSFVAPNFLRLELNFTGSSVIGNSLVGEGFVRRSGTILITVPLSLEVGPTPTQRVLRLATASPRVQVVFLPTRRDYPALTVAAMIEMEVAAEISRLAGPAMDILLPILVDPSAPGLSPLTVADMQLRVFRGSSPSQQSLALFLAFRPSVVGDFTDRVAADLPAGMDFAMTIGAAAFREIILLPAFRRVFRVATTEALPRTLGGASSLAFPLASGPPEGPGMPVARSDIEIERLEAALESGGVGLQIQIRLPDVVSVSTVAFVTGQLRLRVEAGEVRTQWVTRGVDAWHDYDAGWYLHGILHPLGLIGMIVVEAFTHGLAGGFGDTVAGYIPDFRLPLPGTLDGLAFSEIEVMPASLSIGGVAPPRRLTRAARFTLSLTQSPVTGLPESVGRGVYESEGCPRGRYEYETFIQRHNIHFDARLAYEHAPVRYQWEISGIGRRVGIAGEDGPERSATLDVSRTNPGPPPVTDHHVDVEVSYRVSRDGSRLTVVAGPDAGMFVMNVRCVATDASGQEATASSHARFVTRELRFEPPWAEDLDACLGSIDNLGQLADFGEISMAERFPNPGDREQLRILSVIRPDALARLAGRQDKHARATMRNLAMLYGGEIAAALARATPPSLNEIRHAMKARLETRGLKAAGPPLKKETKVSKPPRSPKK